jgi:Spy/CpxP family protein refolding chaperone
MKTRFNKKIATAVLAGLLTVSIIPMTANACRRGGGGGQGGGCGMKGGQKGKHFGGLLGIWKNSQLTEELGLSDAQVNSLKDADFAAREKQQALWAEMESLHLKMEQAFSADTVDEAAVRKLSQKIAGQKGKMIEQRTETRLIAQKLLTPEQRDKAKSLRGNGWGKNKSCMMNGQGNGGNGMKKGQGKMM